MAEINRVIPWLHILLLVCLGLDLKAVNATDPYWFISSINQTVSQSSTATNGEATRAVDGNVFPKPDSCSLTLAETNLRFTIDFGRTIYVPLILIHINEALVSSYGGVQLRIGDSETYGSNTMVRVFTLQRFSYVANNGAKGRYLSLLLSPSNPVALSICEIFAFNVPIDSIAYRKPTTMMLNPNNPATNHPAKNLVDMNFASLASSYNTFDSWMRVDLLDTYFVAEVIIVLYAQHTIAQLGIMIGSSLINEGRSNPICVKDASLVKSEARSFPCGLKGRYIVLVKGFGGKYSVPATELVVNPSHTENIAAGATVTVSGTIPDFSVPATATDGSLTQGAVVTDDAGNGHWLRVDLGSSLPVAKILIFNILNAAYKNEMVGFELRIGDDLTENGNANPLCLPGVHSLLGEVSGSFFCKPRAIGRYVNIHQTDDGKRVAVVEIAVYSESPPEIKERKKSRDIWQKEGTDLTLSCEVHGYPTPVISWLKDGLMVKNDSNTLHISNAQFNNSGAYECWANNTHGQKYKPIEVKITSELRPCVESLEVSYDLGATKPVVEQAFFKDKWYRFYDRSSKKYLQMSKSIPKNSSVCRGWLSGHHPGVRDGIVERSGCVKDAQGDCNQPFTVHVRDCVGFYVYNLPSSREMSDFSYCFMTETKVREIPAVASMTGGPNNALSDHIFHRETEIKGSTQCLLMCSLTANCQSFNFSHKEKTCELNSSTKAKHPGSFRPRKGYNYYAKGKGLLVSRKFGDL